MKVNKRFIMQTYFLLIKYTITNAKISITTITNIIYNRVFDFLGSGVICIYTLYIQI